MKYYIDQKVFYKPSNHHGRYVVIDKIGKKWAYFNYRKKFDIKTGIVDGGKYTSPGKIYSSQEEYEYELFLDQKRSLVWSRVESLYRKLTLEQINKINSILDEVFLGTTQK